MAKFFPKVELSETNHVYAQLINVIAAVGNILTLDTKGFKFLEVYVKASVPMNFRLDVSNDNTNWIESYFTWNNVTEIKEAFWCGFRYVKLFQYGTLNLSDRVTMILCAKS